MTRTHLLTQQLVETITRDRSRLVEAATIAQSRASRPDTSAWVAANAGAGKTHVLKMRVLRLLLSGTPPERIVCLTFTKAAAAEMAERVFRELATWTSLDDDRLAGELVKLTGAVPMPPLLAQARRLFARAIETPGGLKIETIHGFCEKLLQRFPLEAGLMPGFSVLDDIAGATLMRDAVASALGRSGQGGPVDAAVSEVATHLSEYRFDTLIAAATQGRRRPWLQLIDALSRQTAPQEHDTGVDATGVHELIDYLYRRRLSLPEQGTVADSERRLSGLLDDGDLARIIALLRDHGKPNAVKRADALSAILTARSIRERARAMSAALLKSDGQPYAASSLWPADLRRSEPHLGDLLLGAAGAAESEVHVRDALRQISASASLGILAAHVVWGFSAGKARINALDFDDLIDSSVRLLEREGVSPWVLYKLDGGIDHILVDEAQDTSDAQWRIVRALASQFATIARQDGRPRTVFAVGDDKQSIYSFQGAAPDLFDAVGQWFQAEATAHGQNFVRLPLQLSFRTVPPVLQAVDAVFSDPSRTPGISLSGAEVRHDASRLGEGGRVTIWPLEHPPELQETEAFAPLEASAERSATAALASRIATTIASWLESGRRLEAEDRPIWAGDIMILVRRRNPLAAPIIAALKARGIPVAGADRMVISEQLAVQDLIALASFLTTPEDDLALANVLKSPLFDFDDDALIALAPERRHSLWGALVRLGVQPAGEAEVGPGPAVAMPEPLRERLVLAASVLRRWRSMADFTPPFEFFSELLARQSHDTLLTYRQRLLRRLGPDAIDPLDEFLDLALRYDDDNPPSLQGFVTWISETRHEIKRDLESGRDQVRLMTVHGAKGLEAPIVILPDTTSPPHRSGPGSALVDLAGRAGDHDVALTVWTLPRHARHPDVTQANESRTAAEVAELNRLLYVAMTRARDELLICGLAPRRGEVHPQSWYALACAALEHLTVEVQDAWGRSARELHHPQMVPPRPLVDDARPPEAPTEPPAWFSTRAPNPPQRQIPIVPSRLAPLETDAFGDPVTAGHVPAPEAVAGPMTDTVQTPQQRAPSLQSRHDGPTASPRLLAGDLRFLRGIVTHALLQHLPNVHERDRAVIAERFVARRAKALRPATRDAIVRETLALLVDPNIAHAFGPGSRAEVPIAASLPAPDGRGPHLRITGQVDRLCVSDHDVLIIDFKTNRPSPRDSSDIPSAYVLQLSAYRSVFKSLYPNHRVRCALLWTDAARVMEIPAADLDEAELHLWTVRSARLDWPESGT